MIQVFFTAYRIIGYIAHFCQNHVFTKLKRNEAEYSDKNMALQITMKSIFLICMLIPLIGFDMEKNIVVKTLKNRLCV